jgi:hypothetical protein
MVAHVRDAEVVKRMHEVRGSKAHQPRPCLLPACVTRTPSTTKIAGCCDPIPTRVEPGVGCTDSVTQSLDAPYLLKVHQLELG